MSHELRTPLNAIIGFSEIMESGMFGSLGSEKYQEYCHDILTSGHYLLEVINDILDMSKIEAGRMKLDKEELDLAKTLAESLRVVSGRADDKNLDLDAEIDGPISIVADRRATKQIIVNLLSNAVKFTPDGGRIVVRSRLVEDSIVLLIADTGIGIAPQSLRRLGRPFEQVESQLTKTYHGSGLGLAIARSLTNLHGGSMRLRSKLGSGTVVRVSLPRNAARYQNRRCGLISDVDLSRQRRRDLARNLNQRGDQWRHRVALRDHHSDAVVHHRIDNWNAADPVRKPQRFRKLRRHDARPAAGFYMGVEDEERV